MTEEWKIDRVNIPGNFVVQARASRLFTLHGFSIPEEVGRLLGRRKGV